MENAVGFCSISYLVIDQKNSDILAHIAIRRAVFV